MSCKDEVAAGWHEADYTRVSWKLTNGRGTRWQKAHLVADGSGRETVCGRVIPGDSLEEEWGSQRTLCGNCARCATAISASRANRGEVSGLCECGCGKRPPNAPYTNSALGWVRGEPIKTIPGHQGRMSEPEVSPDGAARKAAHGYVWEKRADHPSSRNGWVYQHILVAEAALGKVMPEGAEVHHVNEHKADNRPENLVICEDRAYHGTLHRRTRALRACGNADWYRCRHCREWSPPEDLWIHPERPGMAHHRDCERERIRQGRES